MQYYDENLKFLSGNAYPKGTPEEILNNGMKMYRELSKETGEYFDFMMEHDLIDVIFPCELIHFVNQLIIIVLIPLHIDLLNKL